MFHGSHHTAAFSFAVAGDAGEDMVLDDLPQERLGLREHELSVSSPDGWAKASGFQKGINSQTIRIKFDTTCFTACSANYDLSFTISGPVGTNFK